MAAKKRFQSDALQYTYDKLIGSDPEQKASYEQELIPIEWQSGSTISVSGRAEPAGAGQKRSAPLRPQSAVSKVRTTRDTRFPCRAGLPLRWISASRSGSCQSKRKLPLAES